MTSKTSKSQRWIVKKLTATIQKPSQPSKRTTSILVRMRGVAGNLDFADTDPPGLVGLNNGDAVELTLTMKRQ